jgi:DNA-binding transcriptional ArsR family regulator
MSGTDFVSRIDSSVEVSGSKSADGSIATEESLETTDDDVMDPVRLPLDTVFDLLKNQRRRRVLRYLREEKEETLGDLAEHIAALENQKEVAQLSSSERKRVYVGLYQCHLPRMDDAGVLEFDSNRGTIELNDRAAHLYRYLDETGHRWPLYYGGIALAGAVLYVSSWLALGSTLPVVSSLILTAFIVVISTCAVIQYRSDSRYGHP